MKLSSIFSSLRRVTPHDALVQRFAAARLAYESGDIADAEPEFLHCAHANPADAQAWLYAGRCAVDRGDMGVALERFSTARECDPQDPLCHYWEAAICAAMGRKESAIQGCRAIIAMAPDCDPAYKLWSSLELPGEDYLAVLLRLHAFLRPATYVEIGVFKGESFTFALPETLAIGVDPAPTIEHPLPQRGRVFELTSDDFFATRDVRAEFGGQPVMLAFIDGMHRFEYALRDFINIERVASRESTILIHDCYPLHRVPAERERQSGFWSGDIWRLILLLLKYRPDLRVHTLALAPTGLGVVRGLDPGSTVLADNYAAIVEEFLALDYGVLDADKPGMLKLFPNHWDLIKTLFD